MLEIGAGSGYMAALLSRHARHVVTVEIEPELQKLAEAILKTYVISNVTVALGDAARGWAGSGSHAAPYDVIIVSGSLPVLPQSLLEQVKIGGRLLAIVGNAPVMEACLVKRISADAWDTVTLFETSATPLRNAEAPSAFHF